MELSRTTVRADITSYITDELPEGLSANQYYAELMSELASSVIDVGKSTPVPFDWDLSLYDRPEANENASGNGEATEPVTRRGTGNAVGAVGVGSDLSLAGDDRDDESTRASGGSHDQKGGRGRRGRLGKTAVPLFRVEVGEFVAFSQPKSSTSSVSVGKILSIKEGVDGKEVELQWYMPKKVDPKAPRDQYGRGGWTPEYLIVDGKRVRSISFEYVAAISCKFAKLPRSTKLPSHVWSAIAETAQVQDAVGETGEEDMDAGDEDE